MAPPLKASLLKGSSATLDPGDVGDKPQTHMMDERPGRRPEELGKDAEDWMEEVFQISNESRSLASRLRIPKSIERIKLATIIKDAKANWTPATAPERAAQAAVSELMSKNGAAVGIITANAPDLKLRQLNGRSAQKHVARELHRSRPKRKWVGAEAPRTLMTWLELLWYSLWYLGMYALSYLITLEFVTRVNVDAEQNQFLILAPAGLVMVMSVLVMVLYKRDARAKDFIDHMMPWWVIATVILALVGLAQLMTADGEPQLIMDFNNPDAAIAASSTDAWLNWAGYLARLLAEVMAASLLGIMLISTWNKHGNYVLERDPAEKDLKRLQATLEKELSILNERVAELKSLTSQLVNEARNLVEQITIKMGAPVDFRMKIVGPELEKCYEILSDT